MKKSILIAVAALAGITAFGQNLTSKVPAESQYVMTINTPNILSKMSVEEMEELPMINKAVTDIVKGRKYYDDFSEEDRNLKLNDLGFDLNTASYFFIESNDSMTYFGYLLQINDVAKFEALNDTSMHFVKNTKKLKIRASARQIVAWNNTTALFITSDGNSDYFRNHPEVYASYGYEVDTTDYEYNFYNFYKEQAEIESKWLAEKATSVFAKKSKKSAKSPFLAVADNNAALTMWASPKKLYNQYMGVFTTVTNSPSVFPGGDMVYHLYLNDKDVTLKSAMSLDAEERKSYENIFGNPLNPKFFNYIDANNNLSYYSYNYSVQGVLEEIPHFINNYLGTSFEKWGVQESVDLLSVVLDEEAIGKVVCGDGIMVLTNITSKEVTYTDYEWDEDYMNKTEVTKTKDEIIPEFLYMLSTKDEKSVHNIFKLSMKGNDKLIKEDGFYSLDMYTNAPFKMYFVVRDGIVFMCNTETQLQAILNNTKVTALSAEQIADISSKPFQVYIDGPQIVGHIPVPKEDASNAAKTKKMMDKIKEDVGSFALSQQLEKEGLTFKAVYSFEKDARNSLKYFMHFFNDLYEIEKGDH